MPLSYCTRPIWYGLKVIKICGPHTVIAARPFKGQPVSEIHIFFVHDSSLE